MSVKELSTVEQDLAFRLLHGFWGPLNSLPGRLLCVQTTEQQLPIVKELMETHLSKKGHPVVVNLQDERISEIFDEAMQTMVRNTVQEALKQRQQMEHLAESLTDVIDLLESLKPKTWKDYAKKGLEHIGIISKKKPAEEEVNTVLIEEADDWNEIATVSSYNERVSSILKNWEKHPSIPLEARPTKEYMDYLKYKLLPKARPTVDEPQ